MAKIFISHSTEDKELVKEMVEFMQLGMGIARTDIFCTSYPNTLPTGEGFIEKIREEMRDCEVVIFLITEQYLKSQFCLAELGAAWGLGKKIYPLLLVDSSQIERTPLKGIQVLFLEQESAITVLYGDFLENGIVTPKYAAEYMERLPEFQEKIRIITRGEYLLQKDTDGYYRTEITAVRRVPAEFQCYKIKGHIEDWTGKNAAETDWLFYRTGMYEELKVGDKVRFKVSKTDINNWKDIGLARNIYPADLVKERS